MKARPQRPRTTTLPRTAPRRRLSFFYYFFASPPPLPPSSFSFPFLTHKHCYLLFLLSRVISKDLGLPDPEYEKQGQQEHGDGQDGEDEEEVEAGEDDAADDDEETAESSAGPAEGENGVRRSTIIKVEPKDDSAEEQLDQSTVSCEAEAPEGKDEEQEHAEEVEGEAGDDELEGREGNDEAAPAASSEDGTADRQQPAARPSMVLLGMGAGDTSVVDEDQEESETEEEQAPPPTPSHDADGRDENDDSHDYGGGSSASEAVQDAKLLNGSTAPHVEDAEPPMSDGTSGAADHRDSEPPALAGRTSSPPLRRPSTGMRGDEVVKKRWSNKALIMVNPEDMEVAGTAKANGAVGEGNDGGSDSDGDDHGRGDSEVTSKRQANGHGGHGDDSPAKRKETRVISFAAFADSNAEEDLY